MRQWTRSGWAALAMTFIAHAAVGNGEREPLDPLPPVEDPPGDATVASLEMGKVVVLEPLPLEEPLPAQELLLLQEPLPPVMEPLSLDQEREEASQRLNKEVAQMVESWARAWSEQAMGRYLSHYSQNFKVPGGKSRQQWAEERQRRISKPRFVQVQVSFQGDPRQLTPDRALITFRQEYTSDFYSDLVTKTLELVREQDRWQILEEIAED